MQYCRLTASLSDHARWVISRSSSFGLPSRNICLSNSGAVGSIFRSSNIRITTIPASGPNNARASSRIAVFLASAGDYCYKSGLSASVRSRFKASYLFVGDVADILVRRIPINAKTSDRRPAEIAVSARPKISNHARPAIHDIHAGPFFRSAVNQNHDCFGIKSLRCRRRDR